MLFSVQGERVADKKMKFYFFHLNLFSTTLFHILYQAIRLQHSRPTFSASRVLCGHALTRTGRQIECDPLMQRQIVADRRV